MQALRVSEPHGMNVGDYGGDRREALSASSKAELDGLLDRVGHVAAAIGEL